MPGEEKSPGSLLPPEKHSKPYQKHVPLLQAEGDCWASSLTLLVGTLKQEGGASFTTHST